MSSPHVFRQVGLLAALVFLLSGCGYSDEELQAAYREGHRAGIIWCKRQGDVAAPELDEVLQERWRSGWQEATRVQCEKAARDVTF